MQPSHSTEGDGSSDHGSGDPADPPVERAQRWVQRNDTRLRKVIDLLEANQGVPRHPGPRDGLQVLVVTILSQNTTDPTALKAYLNLLQRFPPAEDYDSETDALPRDEEGNIDTVEIRMSQVADALPSPNWDEVRRAAVDVLEDCIRVCGLQEAKAATIHRVLEWIHDHLGTYDLDALLEGHAPEEAARLLSSVKGVGVKTAAVTLMEANQVDLCPVDTHVHRVCQRLRLVEPSKSRDKTFRDLQPLIPPGKGYSLHHNLLTFGRTVCTARNPRCQDCFLQRICAFYRNGTRDEDMTLKFG